MSNGLSLKDDMAATLQARLSWPQADACAADLMGRFGRMMFSCPLTCEYCRHAPATHLLVTDLVPRRVQALVCGECGFRNFKAAREIALAPSAAWLFRLLPEPGPERAAPVAAGPEE